MEEIGGYPVPLVAAAGTVAAAFIGAVSSMASAFVTHHLTKRRNYSEKIWELRRISYSKLNADLTWIARKLYQWASNPTDALEYPEDIRQRISDATSRISEDWLLMSWNVLTAVDELTTLEPEVQFQLNAEAKKRGHFVKEDRLKIYFHAQRLDDRVTEEMRKEFPKPEELPTLKTRLSKIRRHLRARYRRAVRSWFKSP